jgi:cobalt transporter subunit CbtB
MRLRHPEPLKGRAMSIISSTSHTASSTTTLSQRLGAAIGASILGACLVYFAGFSHIEAVHNAAHDTRHSAAFPCH